MKIRTVGTMALIASFCLWSTGCTKKIYNTFGPSYSYNSGGGYSVYHSTLLGEDLYHTVAVSFIPTTDAVFTKVSVAVSAPSKPFTVSLTNNQNFQDMGGTDGAAGPIEVFNATGTTAPQLLTLNSVLKPQLKAGTKYWIKIDPGANWNTDIKNPDTATWFYNNQNITGEVSIYTAFCKFPCAPNTGPGVAPAVEVLGK